MPSSTTSAWNWKLPDAAEVARHLRQDADDEEVAAEDEGRQRRPQDGQRGVDVDLRQARAGVRQRQQEAADEERARLDARQGRVVHGEQHGLAAHVDVGAEDDGEAQEHELDPPALRADGRPEGLLEVGEDERQGDQQRGVHQLGDRAGAHPPPLGRRLGRQDLEEVVAEAGGERRAGDAGEAEGDGPAAEELAVVAARVREAEGQPGDRQRRLGEEAEREPAVHLLRGRWRAGRAPCTRCRAPAPACRRRSTTRRATASCGRGRRRRGRRRARPTRRGGRGRGPRPRVIVARGLPARPVARGSPPSPSRPVAVTPHRPVARGLRCEARNLRVPTPIPTATTTASATTTATRRQPPMAIAPRRCHRDPDGCAVAPVAVTPRRRHAPSPRSARVAVRSTQPARPHGDPHGDHDGFRDHDGDPAATSGGDRPTAMPS